MMAFFNSVLTVLSFIFIARLMFEFAIAFEHAIVPGTVVGDTVDMTPFLQSLAQSRILIWLSLLVCVELIRPCLSIFYHHDPEDDEPIKQGWAGMVDSSGGLTRLGLQFFGVILLIVLGLKWWALISPSMIVADPNFSKFNWGCLILSSILLNLVPFIPKLRKSDD